MSLQNLLSNHRDERPSFEQQDVQRREAIDRGRDRSELDRISLENDEFGGVTDAFAFPVVMALAAIGLSIIAGAVVVEARPRLILDYFVTVTACMATLITIPLAIIAGLRERRKWRSHKAIRSLASLDPLTGLMNRRSFSAALEDELKRMSRTGEAASVILFDLDHFKQLNDRFGHHVGDQVLDEVASIAYSELRNPFDRLARWGGEEFIILLHDMTEETARGVCDRLRQRIAEIAIDHKGEPVSVTASFGGSLLRPDQPFSEALHQADLALYAAKSNGRNRVSFKRCLQLAG